MVLVWGDGKVGKNIGLKNWQLFSQVKQNPGARAGGAGVRFGEP